MEYKHEKIGKRYAKSLEESMQKTMEETSLFELKQLLMPFIEFNKEKKDWVGLTQDELTMICDSMKTWSSFTVTDVYFAIEAKLKEKNT